MSNPEGSTPEEPKKPEAAAPVPEPTPAPSEPAPTSAEPARAEAADASEPQAAAEPAAKASSSPVAESASAATEAAAEVPAAEAESAQPEGAPEGDGDEALPELPDPMTVVDQVEAVINGTQELRNSLMEYVSKLTRIVEELQEVFALSANMGGDLGKKMKEQLDVTQKIEGELKELVAKDPSFEEITPAVTAVEERLTKLMGSTEFNQVFFRELKTDVVKLREAAERGSAIEQTLLDNRIYRQIVIPARERAERGYGKAILGSNDNVRRLLMEMIAASTEAKEQNETVADVALPLLQEFDKLIDLEILLEEVKSQLGVDLPESDPRVKAIKEAVLAEFQAKLDAELASLRAGARGVEKTGLEAEKAFDAIAGKCEDDLEPHKEAIRKEIARRKDALTGGDEKPAISWVTIVNLDEALQSGKRSLEDRLRSMIGFRKRIGTAMGLVDEVIPQGTPAETQAMQLATTIAQGTVQLLTLEEALRGAEDRDSSVSGMDIPAIAAELGHGALGMDIGRKYIELSSLQEENKQAAAAGEIAAPVLNEETTPTARMHAPSNEIRAKLYEAGYETVESLNALGDDWSETGLSEEEIAEAKAGLAEYNAKAAADQDDTGEATA